MGVCESGLVNVEKPRTASTEIPAMLLAHAIDIATRAAENLIEFFKGHAANGEAKGAKLTLGFRS